MIQLAIVTKGNPKYFLPQFLSILRETDEFDSLIIKDTPDQKIFDIFSVYRDFDLNGLNNSKNYSEICKDLHVDNRSIPDYLQDWEWKKIKDILSTYLSIALEDLRSH